MHVLWDLGLLRPSSSGAVTAAGPVGPRVRVVTPRRLPG
jgi:hypothetical protein